MKRALPLLGLFAVLLLSQTGCRKIKEKLFGSSPPPVAESEEDPSCTIHPGWCRGHCKSWAERYLERHADRVRSSSGFAIGKCGAYDVFAENDSSGGGIVEYYDEHGVLVAATDTRSGAKCAAYGAVPTCSVRIRWSDAGLDDRLKVDDGF